MIPSSTKKTAQYKKGNIKKRKKIADTESNIAIEETSTYFDARWSIVLQNSTTCRWIKWWNTFEIPSLLRTWSSRGLSSYSGTSRGFATVIGVFLVFYEQDKYIHDYLQTNKHFYAIEEQLMYRSFSSACLQDIVNFDIAIVLCISCCLLWKINNITTQRMKHSQSRGSPGYYVTNGNLSVVVQQ